MAQLSSTTIYGDLIVTGNATLAGSQNVLQIGLLDTNATHYLLLAAGSDLTTNRTLTLTTGDADRTISLSGNLTTAGAFTTSGAYAVTLTATNTTTVTLPTTGTLATLAGSESLTNKKLGSLTSNGFVKTSNGDGTLSVDTSTYSLSSHTHSYAGSASAGGAANSVANALTFSTGITVSSGSTFDGSAARTISVAYGSTSTTACVGNDSRLSDARTPVSHAHGNITNAGAIGSTSGLMVITTTSGVLTTLAAGSSGQYLSYNGTWATPPDTNTWTALTGTVSGYVTAQGASSTSVWLNGNAAWSTPTASQVGALSNSSSSTQNGYFGDIYLYDDSTPSHYLRITNSADLTSIRSLSINVNDANRTISLSGNLTIAGDFTTSGAYAVTLTATNTTTVTLPTTGTLATLAGSEALTNKSYNGYTLAAACAYAVTDSTSASAIGTGTSLVTERDVYYGLPTLNNAHAYTSSSTFYAPTAGGTANTVLVGAGTTAAPTWTTGTLTLSAASLVVGTATTNTGTVTLQSNGTSATTINGPNGGTATLQAGTMAVTGGKLSQFAATTSAELAGVISDETGYSSGALLVFSISPSLTTPSLGVATATSINKVAITTPATSATITVADGKTLTVNNSLTFSGTDASTLNIGTGGTLGTAAYTASTAYATSSHAHGNITNAGYIGSTASVPIITGTGGILQAGSFGTTSGTFCAGDDSRLSNSRTPTAHQLDSATFHTVSGLTTGHFLKATSATTFGFAAHGLTYSDVGAQQVHANLTSLSSLTYSSASFVKMTSAGTFSLDTLTYAASSHTHGNITNAGAIGSTSGLMVITTTSGVLTTLAAGSSGQYLSYNGTWATPPDLNYYPTTFTWSGGTSSGPTGSLTGSGMSAVSFAAIPSASSSASGIITTGTQTIAGAKTISNSDSATNTVLYPLSLDRQTSAGSPAIGIGSGLKFLCSSAANYFVASIEAVATDVTDNFEDYNLVFKIMSNGSEPTVSAVTFSNAGVITASSFSGSVSGSISGGIVAGTNIRIPTAQPSSLANGDIWVV